MNQLSRFFHRAAAAVRACGVGALLLLLLPLLPITAARAADEHWAASWAAAPQDYQQLPPALRVAPPEALAASGAMTLRERLLPTLGGRYVRVRFSNVFGKAPLHIVAASVARSTGGAAVSPATLRPLHFGGRTDITLAPGAEAWSDAARLSLEPGQAAAVSFALDAPTPFATVHHLPPDGTWMLPGDAVLRTSWRDAVPSPWNHVVTGLDVASTTTPRVLVAFGDSITEGVGSQDAQGRPGSYPDQLATRLRGRPGGGSGIAVINAGIAGNRLLADQIGLAGIARFQRDVLAQSGVTHVLIFIGINDLLFGQSPGVTDGGKPLPEAPAVEQITAGLQQLIRRSRDKGVKVQLATLLPFKGMPAPYWSEEREARRQAVNRWIRGRQDVEAVVDFDAALRDPADAAALNPRYDSGDHLHPSHAGHAAMAGAIDLQELQE